MDLILGALQTLAGIVPDSWKPYAAGLIVAWAGYSLLVAWLNKMVRDWAEGGKPMGPGILKTIGILNFPALNPDKALQLWKGYRGPSQTALKK